MLINQEYSVDFLNSKLGGPYVELNPVTGKPRLIHGLNEVWGVVNEFGGIAKTARHFAINERFVHDWVDRHFIPYIFAYEIAKILGYSRHADFQEPSTGYEDTETGYCWPMTWKLGWAEMGVLPKL
jgi:hypothetical protein